MRVADESNAVAETGAAGLRKILAGVGETVFFVRGKEAMFPWYPTEVPAGTSRTCRTMVRTRSTGARPGLSGTGATRTLAYEPAPVESSEQENRQLRRGGALHYDQRKNHLEAKGLFGAASDTLTGLRLTRLATQSIDLNATLRAQSRPKRNTIQKSAQATASSTSRPAQSC